MCRLKEYETFLLEQEYSVNTIRKYVRDVGRFLEYAGTEEPDRMMTLLYKEELQNHYQLSSVNSVLASMNSYLKYIGKADYRVHRNPDWRAETYHGGGSGNRSSKCVF